MKRSICLIMAVLCGGMMAAQQATAQQPVVLENDELKVALSPQNATVISVVNKRTGQSWLDSSSQSGWFRIQIPLPHWEGHAVASQNLEAMTLQRPSQGAVEFQTAALDGKEGRFAIGTTISFRLEGQNLVCRLSLKNQSKATVDRIAFPILDVPPGSKTAENLVLPEYAIPLRLTFSPNAIRTDHNPFDALDRVDGQAWTQIDPKISIKAFNYPMYMSTPWAMYAADGKGLGFDIRDQRFQYQKFLIERRLVRDAVSPKANRQDYELSWNWYPLVRPGASWESPEVRIRFDDGDWHGIALQHRNWLKTWIRRPDVARLFQSSIGWISRGPRSFDEIPAIAQQGVDVGAPYFLVYNWTAQEAAEMAYGVVPTIAAGGIEGLKRNLKKARELGAHPLAWFNSTLSGDTQPGHMMRGKDLIARTRWGGGILDGEWSLFNTILIATMPINQQWLQFDPSASKDLLLDSIRRFIEGYGFSGFEFDQALKFYLSYRDPAHVGPEVAYTQGYADFYKAAIEIVKRADPDGIIIGEGMSDFTNQYVDSSWIFEGGALNLTQMTRTRYCLPWVTLPVRADVTNRGHANQAFMMNAPLNIFDDLKNHPEYAAHLRRLHDLKKQTTQYFYGGDFSDAEGFSISAAEGVTARSYQSGKFLAVVVVNTGSNSQECTLKPKAPVASRQVRRFSLDGGTETQQPSPEIRLKLSAYDVQILSFEMP